MFGRSWYPPARPIHSTNIYNTLVTTGAWFGRSWYPPAHAIMCASSLNDFSVPKILTLRRIGIFIDSPWFTHYTSSSYWGVIFYFRLMNTKVLHEIIKKISWWNRVPSINFSIFNGIVLWVNFLDLIKYYKELQKTQCCLSPCNRKFPNLMKYVLMDNTRFIFFSRFN